MSPLTLAKILLAPAVAAAVAVPLLGPAPASAATCLPDPLNGVCVLPVTYKVNNTATKVAVQQSSKTGTVLRYLTSGTAIGIICQVNNGGTADGRTSTTWDAISGGGWVYDDRTTTPAVGADGYSPGIRHCGAPVITTPTTSPATTPTKAPTTSPTTAPSTSPATTPTKAPTTSPTTAPSTSPTTAPTSPSPSPSTSPTASPTTAPTTPTTSPATFNAAAYPWPTQDGWVVDGHGYYEGECASFAAWAVRTDGRPDTTSPDFLGNAGQWKGAYVDATPQPGDVAQWDAGFNGAGSVGHVGYVKAVNADGTVVINEYNWGNFHRLNVRTIPAKNPSRYLHF